MTEKTDFHLVLTSHVDLIFDEGSFIIELSSIQLNIFIAAKEVVCVLLFVCPSFACSAVSSTRTTRLILISLWDQYFGSSSFLLGCVPFT